MKNSKLLLILFITFCSYSQEIKTSQIVNPAGKWFFGAEIGPNIITSYTLGEPNKSLQGGILAEYYFSQNFSVTGRIKYFKTGLSDFKNGIVGGSNFLSTSYLGSFKEFNGEIITIPININCEISIWQKLNATLNFGLNYNYENKSNYNYSDNQNTEYSRHYLGLNTGMGFGYFLSKKVTVFTNIEGYVGTGYKGNNNEFIKIPYLTTNVVINYGVKYNFNN